jgi:hypothetical protein
VLVVGTRDCKVVVDTLLVVTVVAEVRDRGTVVVMVIGASVIGAAVGWEDFASASLRRNSVMMNGISIATKIKARQPATMTHQLRCL